MAELSKRVENAVGKGEIAPYEQFLLSHSFFKRLVSQGPYCIGMGYNAAFNQSVIRPIRDSNSTIQPNQFLKRPFNNCHVLRWYEWDLLVFCKQTPF